MLFTVFLDSVSSRTSKEIGIESEGLQQANIESLRTCKEKEWCMEMEQMINMNCAKWHMQQNETRDINLCGVATRSFHATLMNSDFIL